VPLAEPNGKYTDAISQRGNKKFRRGHGRIRSAFLLLLIGNDFMPSAYGSKQKILFQIHFHFHDPTPLIFLFLSLYLLPTPN
jgi:hypothetical protein